VPDRPLVALTGGTGFIGKHVAAALTEAGWRVRMLVRQDPVNPLPSAVPTELVLGDLDSPDALARLVRGADAIIHLAGLTKAPGPAAFMRVNRDGVRLLASILVREAPAARRILMSSMAAREPGLSPYAASKRAGEDAARAVPGGAAWTILRPGVVYGPGDREGLALRRLGSLPLIPVPLAPEPRIAMIHVADLARAVVSLCGNQESGGRFELSDERSEGYGMGELLALTAKLLGRPPPRLLPMPGAAFWAAGLAADAAAGMTGRRGIFGRGKVRELLHRDWHANPALAISPTLWVPRIGLADGMAQTARWWRTQT
jgi:nucleoside-diphosphate-sugar epimerase